MLPLQRVYLFSLTIFLSAALAFLAQPLIAKKLLPLLGGSPSVWNTCLVFFQTTLLLGYALSHRIVRLKPRTQVVVQVALLGVAAVLALRGTFAPLVAPETTVSPTAWLLRTLAATVGIPFLALSINSTLLQHWYGLSGSTATPYSLYRASNLGSLLGLLAFPFVFEPFVALSTQGRVWLVGFGLLVVLVALCGRALERREETAVAYDHYTNQVGEHITWPRRLCWVVTAFVPSSLTIGVTTFMSTDMAAVPLLWVVPLSLYLLSFALTFGPRPVVRLQAAASWVFPVLAIFVLATLHLPAMVPTVGHVMAHPLLLFAVGILAHGALAANKPSPVHLTEFYLFVAIGGALGGTFNALVAPHIFNSLLEYPLVITLAAFVLPMVRHGVGKPSLPDVAIGLGIGLLVLATTAIVQRTMRHSLSATLVIFALPVVLYLIVRERWVRAGTAVLGILFVAVILPGQSSRVLYNTRTFFGTLRVVASSNMRFHVLMHGTTAHGRQDRRGPVMRRLPLSYYHPQGPIGQLVGTQRTWNRPLRFGIVGLGTGTMAAYAEKGDEVVFYEIDAEVVKIAQTPPWFSFLADTEGITRIVLGDGRLSLDRSAPERFDLLLLDAFSSDAIPVHLITREAFEIYKRHLSAEGLIVTHVSNRHIEMGATITSIAQSVGLRSVRQDAGVTREATAQGYSASRWVASGTADALAANRLPTAMWAPAPISTVRPWTDDYSNLASVIAWRNRGASDP